jgi:hypothetical protein
MNMATQHEAQSHPEVLVGSPYDLVLGKWSARAISALSIPYALTIVIGFSSMGNMRDPLAGPYLAAVGSADPADGAVHAHGCAQR